jgi:hypothetical protein
MWRHTRNIDRLWRCQALSRMDRWGDWRYATESIWFRRESPMSQELRVSIRRSISLKKISNLDLSTCGPQEEHTTENQPTSLESTPKKLLFWENNRSSSSAGNKSDELMTIRLREMEAVTELRELRLRLMELETQVIENRRKTAVFIVVPLGNPGTYLRP